MTHPGSGLTLSAAWSLAQKRRAPKPTPRCQACTGWPSDLARSSKREPTERRGERPLSKKQRNQGKRSKSYTELTRRPAWQSPARLWLVGIGLVVIVLVIIVVVNPFGGKNSSGLPTIQFVGNASCPTSGQQPYFAPQPASVNSLPPAGQAIDEMPHTHVNPPTVVAYNHNPPTSGCHYNLGYPNAPMRPAHTTR